MNAPRALRASFLTFWTVAALVLSSCGGAAAPAAATAVPTVAPTAAVAAAAPAMLLTPANSVPQPFVWVKASAAFPAGLEVMVMEGDPSKAGAPFTQRLKFPDG